MPSKQAEPEPAAGVVIATVSGRPIDRKRVVDLLLRGHGPAVLEQLAVLELAQQRASDIGLTITDADMTREADLALRRLVDPLGLEPSGSFDREKAEGILSAVLARRDIPREEYRVSLERNATLRRIVESTLVITEAQVHNEFARQYGDRVEVRHIQLATLGEVSRVKERLAKGESFEELARQYSANRESGEKGGLLDPVSLSDEEVPAVLRDVLGKLKPGQLSDAIRVGDWYQIFQVVQNLPAEAVSLESVREELKQRIRERLAEPAIQALHEELYRSARIEILDPGLKEAVGRVNDRRSGKNRVAN